MFLVFFFKLSQFCVIFGLESLKVPGGRPCLARFCAMPVLLPLLHFVSLFHNVPTKTIEGCGRHGNPWTKFKGNPFKAPDVETCLSIQSATVVICGFLLSTNRP